jgi:hypothetical protein
MCGILAIPEIPELVLWVSGRQRLEGGVFPADALPVVHRLSPWSAVAAAYKIHSFGHILPPPTKSIVLVKFCRRLQNP